MRCPFCGSPDTRVINSRPSPTGESIRRRRECVACKQRFTTAEYVERLEMAIVKRDGTREPYERGKVRRGIEKACEKRPVSAEEIDQVMRGVERDLLATTDREIPSEAVGKAVLAHLKNLDAVAYVRYASVYKQFRDLHDFNAEIETLLKD
ncbi:MAG: transcriptional regulator NrdR [Sumerlaeia bacterium]